MAVRAGTIGGWLAVFATLLLLSPGVRVRADEAGPVSEVPQGPTCSDAQKSRPDPIASLDQTIELARQQAMLQQAQSQDGDDDRPVMLNNRGFNYGSSAGAKVPPAAPSPAAPR